MLELPFNAQFPRNWRLRVFQRNRAPKVKATLISIAFVLSACSPPTQTVRPSQVEASPVSQTAASIKIDGLSTVYSLNESSD